jgi:hypothetical protein
MMKRVLIGLSLCVLVLVGSGVAMADGALTLDWWTLGGGGGYEVSGNYELYSAVGVWYETPSLTGSQLYLPVISRQ